MRAKQEGTEQEKINPSREEIGRHLVRQRQYQEKQGVVKQSHDQRLKEQSSTWEKK